MRVQYGFRLIKEIRYSLVVLFIIFIGGTVGYKFIEDYTLLDAFYMTVITVTTVGYGEVMPLGPGGKIFTALLILLTFGVFAYAITSITRYLVTGEYKIYIKNYRVIKELQGLDGHVIVCGYGRNGVQAVETLAAHGMRFVVVEQNEDLVRRLQEERNDILIIEGDATDESMIERAQIHKASALIATLPKDADNLFVVLTARELNKNLTIISRASDDRSEKKLKIAGANSVILPDKVGGSHMASLVVTPDLMEFLDHISVIGKDQTSLIELTIPGQHQPERSIKDLEVQRQTGARIVGMKTEARDIIVNPPADMKLIAGAKLFVLGTAEQVKKLEVALKD